MVKKTDLLKDLKKYNKELEKHVGSVDDELLMDKAALSESGSSKDEYFTLLSSNLMDLRTEVNLMRNNLTNDVQKLAENMTRQSEENIIKLMRSVESKIFLETKKMLNTHFEMVSSELHVLSDRIKESESRISSTSSVVEDVKDVLEYQFALLEQSNKHMEKRFIVLQSDAQKALISKEEMHELNDRQKKMSQEVIGAQKHFEKNIVSLTKKFAQFERQLSVAKKEKISIPHKTKEVKVEKMVDVEEDLIDISDLKTDKNEDEERVDRIANIDERLSRLHSIK